MISDSEKTSQEEDSLGRVKFAKNIAFGIVQTIGKGRDSLVFGLNGIWGSGKSTLLNFIVEEIKFIEPTFIIIRFNPWMFSNQEKLQDSFLRVLESNLGGKKQKFYSLLRFLRWIKFLKPIKYIHSGAGQIANEIALFLDGVSHRSIDTLKASVDKSLEKNNLKLLILIDDIDRLKPKEIQEIFQLIKLNANFLNTVFLIAFDKDLVVRSLDLEFNFRGEKYLEKIIQVDYTIPQIGSHKIKETLQKLFNGLGSKTDQKYDFERFLIDYWDECLGNYFQTVRDVNRYWNSIELRFIPLASEINFEDFLLLEVLRVFDYKSYYYVLKNRKYLTRSGSKERSEPTYIDGLPNDLTELDRHSKIIVRRIFYLGSEKLPVDETNVYKNKRLYSDYFFPRYFALEIGYRQISESLISSFLNADSIPKRIEIIKVIRDGFEIVDFLNILESRVASFDKNKQYSIILSLLASLENERYEKLRPHSLFDNNLATWYFLWKILKDNIYSEKYIRCFLEEFRNLLFGFKFCYFKFLSDIFIDINNVREAKKANQTQSWVDVDNAKLLEEELKDDFQEMISSGGEQLLNKSIQLGPDEMELLLFYLDKIHPEVYSRVIKMIKSHTSEVFAILEQIIQRRYIYVTSSIDSSEIGFALSLDSFYKGLEPEVIEGILENLSVETLNENQKKLYNFFFRAKKEGFKENYYFDFTNLNIVSSR